MKRFIFLSVLYIYLETGFCLEEPNISPADTKQSPELRTTIVKRNTAFKRLPAWSVYYGKRSGKPFDSHNIGEDEKEEGIDFESIANADLLEDITDIDSVEKAFQQAMMNKYLDQTAPNEGLLDLNDEKRSNLKRLQPWMSTYGKRSDDTLDANTGHTAEAIKTFSADGHDLEQIRKHLYGLEASDFDMDDLQRNFDWNQKRLAGWSATYGKRAPWSVTYGKRAPWTATYGKRAPWSVTYGKRAPWSVTYGKRAPWSVTYGKRAPWTATYGKRAPWTATYGKRAPWTATYGKRSQGWQAFYGKRGPVWQAVYGKRNADDASSQVEHTNLIGNLEDTSNGDEKRASQAWSAFYGR